MRGDEISTASAALSGAAAIVEFAERWERQLGRMARNIQCTCERPNAGTEELEHEPNCPIGVLRQAGRLMREEAEEARDQARQ